MLLLFSFLNTRGYFACSVYLFLVSRYYVFNGAHLWFLPRSLSGLFRVLLVSLLLPPPPLISNGVIYQL